MDIENKWEHVRSANKHETENKTYAICFSASFSMTTSATADAPIISPSRSIVYSSGAKKLIKLPNLAVLQTDGPNLSSQFYHLVRNPSSWYLLVKNIRANKAFLIDVTWFHGHLKATQGQVHWIHWMTSQQHQVEHKINESKTKILNQRASSSSNVFDEPVIMIQLPCRQLVAWDAS